MGARSPRMLVVVIIVIVVSLMVGCGEGGGYGTPGSTKVKQINGRECIVGYDGDGYISALSCDWGPG